MQAPPTSRASSVRSWTRLGDNHLVRVIDALGVRTGVDGEVEVLHDSQLGADRQAAFGALAGGLPVLGAAGEEGLELGAEALASVAARPREPELNPEGA